MSWDVVCRLTPPSGEFSFGIGLPSKDRHQGQQYKRKQQPNGKYLIKFRLYMGHKFVNSKSVWVLSKEPPSNMPGAQSCHCI